MVPSNNSHESIPVVVEFSKDPPYILVLNHFGSKKFKDICVGNLVVAYSVWGKVTKGVWLVEEEISCADKNKKILFFKKITSDIPSESTYSSHTHLGEEWLSLFPDKEDFLNEISGN